LQEIIAFRAIFSIPIVRSNLPPSSANDSQENLRPRASQKAVEFGILRFLTWAIGLGNAESQEQSVLPVLGGQNIELLEREQQLKRVEKAFALVRGGSGRAVAIAGEAGVGKTMLVERFCRRRRQARVHRGAGENLSTPEALLPLRDIVRASGEAFDPNGDHIRSFDSLLGILSVRALPSVVAIEDLHWADTVTLDLIRFLTRRIRSVRALILLTYRDEELDARSPMRSLLGEAPPESVERMTIESLSKGAVTKLAERVGKSGEALFALTAGNPFLVTETLAVDGDVPTDAVRDATVARAARLPPEARVVLELASIFPRRADTSS
jgi:hypothetical protein